MIHKYLHACERAIAGSGGLGLSMCGQHLGRVSPSRVSWVICWKTLGATTIYDLGQHRDGERVLVAGAVISRQKPPTAKGMGFLILEDETGRLPTALPPQVWDRFTVALRAPALLVEGRLENGMSEQASTCRTVKGASAYRSVLIGRVWVLELVASSGAPHLRPVEAR